MKKPGLRSFGDAWADTTTSTLAADADRLGGLAEFERDLIRARTGEGRERAKRTQNIANNSIRAPFPRSMQSCAT